MTHNLKIMMMDMVFDDESSYDACEQPETEHVVELLIVWMLFQGSLGLHWLKYGKHVPGNVLTSMFEADKNVN